MRVLSLKKLAKLEALERCLGRATCRIDLELSADSGFTGALPMADSSFHSAMAIDVLEHVPADDLLLAELHRVLMPGGFLFLSVPRSDRHLGLNRLRRAIGMTPDVYGHVREGYSVKGLRDKLHGAGFAVVSMHTFCGPLTELVEMVLNRAYLAFGGEISPLRGEGGMASAAALVLYRAAYPVLRLVAMLDRFAFPKQRYGIAAKALRRP